MIDDPDDPDLPRMVRLTITDEGESWRVQVERNRVKPTDDDVCGMCSQLKSVVDQLHHEAHIAAELAERRN